MCYLHRIDPAVPFLDQVGTLAELHSEGKIAHIGLSKVTPEEIDAAFTVIRVAAVQNKLSMAVPDDLPTVEHCRRLGIPYVPYAPLGAGALTGDVGTALRWLLDLGNHVAPIPATSSTRHLHELMQAGASVTRRTAQPPRNAPAGPPSTPKTTTPVAGTSPQAART